MKPWQNPSFLELLKLSVLEDLQTGDTTTELFVPQDKICKAQLIAKESCVVCGQYVAKTVFSFFDPSVDYRVIENDGASVNNGTVIAEIEGNAASMLSAERIALNFMQRMSGIATATKNLVKRVDGTSCKVVDTRKTVPGHRLTDKYAVRVGGGHNHRFNLGDGILIKENHIVAAGGITKAVEAALEFSRHNLKVQIEVKNLEEVKEAVAAGAEALLLDNMRPEQVKTIVNQFGESVLLESSGNISEATIRGYAEAGVDIISVGALTHSVKAADLSLIFTE